MRAPNFNTSKLAMLALTASFALTGCGGGSGGGSTASPTPTPAPSPTPTPTPAPTPTPTPTGTSFPNVSTVAPVGVYASAENGNVFDGINAARISTGVGGLNQALKLDTASANHVSFIASNNLVFNTDYMTNPAKGLHWEDSALPGFTGATPGDRVAFVQYTHGSMEDGAVAFGITGAQCASLLVDDTVYHRGSVLSPATDIGVSIQAVGQGYFACFMEIGLTGTDQLPADIVAYPYSGQTGVHTTFIPSTESPNPAPDLAEAGIPIMVSLYSQKTQPSIITAFFASDVAISQFSVTAQGSTTAVTTRVLAQTGVTSTGPTLTVDGRLRDGQIFLLPTAKLLTNTVYNVLFSGAVRGIPVTKSWSFTTGPV